MNVKQKERRQNRIARRVAARQARRTERQQNFLGPHTPQQARKIAKAEVGTEYRPTERQIASEIRGSKKREKEISGWYTDLENQYAQGQQAASAAADAANAATAANLGQTSANTSALLQGLASKDASFAAQVGGPTNTAGQQQQAEAAAAAERMRAALQAPLAASRAINVADFTSKRGTAALAGIQAHKANASTRSKEQSDLRALKGEHGAAIIKAVQALREGDQNYSTQQAALGVKTNEVGAKEHYNRALEEQAKLGLKGKQVSAAAQLAAAEAYAAAKERGASAQEAVAAAQKAAARIKARSNENVARQQGKNASKGSSGGRNYSIAEAEQFVHSANRSNFATPGEIVRYLVNVRKVKENVAKRAAHNIWKAAHAG